MAYCAPKGIPHSVFLSWPDADQDKALEFQALEANRCPFCGSEDADWIDPETKRLLPKPKYRTSTRRCYGCVEIEGARKEVPKEDHSTYVSLVVDDG